MTHVSFSEALKALKTQNIAWLESTFGGIQYAFESGRMSEDDYIGTFDVFASGFASVGHGCQAWIKLLPKSYNAHLAYAKWLANKAFEARGEKLANAVSKRAWQEVHSYGKTAKDVLESSLKLTYLPLLSHLLLGRLEMVLGTSEHLLPEQQPTWYRKALELCPNSFAPRNAYLHYLQPHWHGSEQAMLDFVHHPDQRHHQQRLTFSYHCCMGLYYASFERGVSEQHFNIAHSIYSGKAGWYWSKARAAISAGDRLGCLQDFRQAICIDSKTVHFYEDLYNCLPRKDGASFAEALELLDKGIELGSLQLLHRRCALYREGRFGQPIDNIKALEYALYAAEEGHAGASYIASRILYEQGHKPKALMMALESAKAGDAYACNWVHYLYRKGGYPHMEPVEALEFLLQASQDGHKEAPYWIGIQILTGKVHHNTQQEQWNNGPAAHPTICQQQALEWFLRSADMGDPDGMEHAARIYLAGNQTNLQAAVYWYQKAIEYGVETSDAYANLGYILGLGSEQSLHDHPKAIQLYRKALDTWTPDQEDSRANWWCNLAVILENSSNLEDAKAAYREAAQLGDNDAKQRLQQLEGNFLTRLFKRH